MIENQARPGAAAVAREGRAAERRGKGGARSATAAGGGLREHAASTGGRGRGSTGGGGEEGRGVAVKLGASL
jgi:hypothetical protein